MTFKNDCYDTVLSDPAFTLTEFSQNLWNEGKFTFTAPTSTKPNCGDWVYRLTLIDDTDVNVYSIDVDTTPATPFVSGTPTAKDPWTLQTFDFYIKATLGDFGTVTSAPITLTVVDPCITNTITSQALSKMTYSVKFPDATT